MVKDNELVTRLRNDDVDSFDILYRQYHQALYLNINKLVKDADLTQDILQEVFITLWEKRLTLDPAQSIAGWLFVVSYNKAVRYLKNALQQSLTQNSIRSEPQWLNDPEPDIKEARWKILEEAIAHLPPQKRKVFELCKIQGKSYEQTAVELDISKHTVKEYLSGATNYIRSYVRRHPEYHSIGISLILIIRFLAN